MAAVVVVDIVPGTPTVGLWCDRCQLPSGVEVPVHALSASGVGQIAVMRHCTDCCEPLTTNEGNT